MQADTQKAHSNTQMTMVSMYTQKVMTSKPHSFNCDQSNQ